MHKYPSEKKEKRNIKKLVYLQSNWIYLKEYIKNLEDNEIIDKDIH